MESSEQGVSEFQGFSGDDSVIIYQTPEKLNLVIHLKEALDIFSGDELSRKLHTYVVSGCGISYLYWSEIYTRAI